MVNRPWSMLALAAGVVLIAAHGAAAQDRVPPTIVCGTTILPASPNIDRKMARPAPPGTFTLRSIEPGVCRGVAVPSREDVRDLKQRLPIFLGPNIRR